MIADLLPTRLYWVGLRGVARMRGREVKLTTPPDIGTPMEAMDFAPGEVCLVMPKREGWRDMTPAEVEAAWRVLEQMTGPHDGAVSPAGSGGPGPYRPPPK